MILRNIYYISFQVIELENYKTIVVLVDESQSEGEHQVTFNAANLPSGVYFYRIKTPEKVEVQKMVFTK